MQGKLLAGKLKKPGNRDRDASLQRCENWQLGMWAVCMVFASTGAGWPGFVRHTWLNQLPLLDELALVLLLGLPLVLTWGIHYWLHELQPRSASRIQSLAQFVGIRLQVYCGLPLLPMLVVWLFNDLAHWLITDPQWQWAGAMIGLVASILWFPWLLKMTCHSQPVSDAQLRNRCTEICDSMGVRFTEVRIWNTGNRIANAMVTGVLGPLRILWLTDALLQELNADELETVIRHEAGHVRRQHLLLRTWLLALPLVMAAVAISLLPNQLGRVLEVAELHGVPRGWLAWVLVPSLTIAYLTGVISWFSHRMEFDADLEACSLPCSEALVPTVAAAEPATGNLALGFETGRWGGWTGRRESQSAQQERLCSQAVETYRNALIKLAPPQQDLERQSLLHPSILCRAQFLSQALSGRIDPVAFRRRTRWVSWAITFSMLALLAAIALA